MKLIFPLPVPGENSWLESIYDLIFSANTCESVCGLDNMHPICFGFFLNYDYIANVFGRNESESQNITNTVDGVANVTIDVITNEIIDDVSNKLNDGAEKEITSYTNYDTPNEQKIDDNTELETTDDPANNKYHDISNAESNYDVTDTSKGPNYDVSSSFGNNQNYDYRVGEMKDIKVKLTFPF